MNVFDTLKERGFIEQMTHEEEIRELLGKEKIKFYMGFDPTADSLHVGHFMVVMAMAHMQKAGHTPIALFGGGTGNVGDPTDRTEMRRLMSKEEISKNVANFKKQFSKFIDFENDKALMVDNADWLLDLKYIEFIREYGVHFSVNRMLTAESYKARLEKGLSFFEFNYMLMQAYDYLVLNRKYDCKLQLGGNDQWSNVIAGVDLIRRVEQKNVYGMTFTLLTKSDGEKMGKSMGGAVWLDEEKTSPYEFFQYWRNVDDADVIKFLKLLTFLSMDEINELEKLKGSEINKAKEILAYEVTKNVHSKEDADKSLEASKSLFSGKKDNENIPSKDLNKSEIEKGINIIILLEKMDLIKSRSDGRRLVEQNGISINDEKISDVNMLITLEDFLNNEMIIQKGKKIFLKVKLV